jgi:hypothetical protein
LIAAGLKPGPRAQKFKPKRILFAILTRFKYQVYDLAPCQINEDIVVLLILGFFTFSKFHKISRKFTGMIYIDTLKMELERTKFIKFLKAVFFVKNTPKMVL